MSTKRKSALEYMYDLCIFASFERSLILLICNILMLNSVSYLTLPSLFSKNDFWSVPNRSYILSTAESIYTCNSVTYIF